jgi:ribonucleoside-triphosphate reductase
MNKRKIKDVYKVKNNSIYFKINSIEKYNYNNDFVYCFEVSNQEEPYFTLPNGIITHNCRLLSNTNKLNGFINSIGGTSLSVGSVQVNTTNLRRIAIESNKNKDKYIEILSKRTHLSIKLLDTIRNIIKRNVEKGLLPNYTYELIKMDNQYNTLGITAMYEAIRDMDLIDIDEFGNKSYTEEGLNFASTILKTINEIKDSYNFDYSINIEAVPAERANSILCTKDNLLYPEYEQDFLYSNQWIPLMEQCTIQEKIRLGAVLDKECGGGQILHVNLQGKFANEEQSWDMLNHLAKSGIIYFAYNVKISVCDEGHGFFGNACPTCGKPVQDIFSRIVGYLVPTQSYSKERKQEFDKRRWFLLD